MARNAALVAYCAVLLLAATATAPSTATSTTTTTTLKPALLNASTTATPLKVNFTDCGPHKNIREVRITPCNLTGSADASVCSILLGANVTVEADFVARVDAASLGEQIKGVVRGRELPFPEQRKDPCKSTISPHCPIKVGAAYKYKARFEIKPYYPAIPVKVRYALVSQSTGETVACVQIGAKIVDPNPVVKASAAAAAKKKNHAR